MLLIARFLFLYLPLEKQKRFMLFIPYAGRYAPNLLQRKGAYTAASTGIGAARLKMKRVTPHHVSCTAGQRSHPAPRSEGYTPEGSLPGPPHGVVRRLRQIGHLPVPQL